MDDLPVQVIQERVVSLVGPLLCPALRDLCRKFVSTRPRTATLSPMLPPATIETLRRHLWRGTRVILQLEDGSEMRGTVAAVAADGIRLHGVADRIPFSVISDVLLEIGTDGPE